MATKRVGHSRQRGFLLLKQQYNAMGGMYTIYMTTFFGMAGSAFGLSSQTAFARPLMSSAGLRSVARNTVLAGGPAILGFMIGVNAFGNPSELGNLIWNAGTYRREFKEVQKEFYY